MSDQKLTHLLAFLLFFFILLAPKPSLAREPAIPQISYITKRNTPYYISYYDMNGKIIRSIDKRKKMVAITYDDGPSQNTEKILKILKKYNSVATFFVIGNQVEEYSDSVKMAHNIGCEIGNHTYDHELLTSLSISEIQHQINSTNNIVNDITGATPILMRPPCGLNDCWIDQNITMPLILWSIDTLDWKTLNPSNTVNAVLKDVTDGDIILMHDYYAETAIASETIIPSLIVEGYQLVTVSELAQCRGIKLEPGKVYRSFPDSN